MPSVNEINWDQLLEKIHTRIISIKNEEFNKSRIVCNKVLEQVKKMMKSYCPYFKKFSKNIPYEENIYEELKVSKYNEFERTTVIHLPIDVKSIQINCDEEQPGFVTIKIDKAFDLLERQQNFKELHAIACAWRDGDKYLLKTYFRSWLQDVAQKALKELDYQVIVEEVSYSVNYKKSGTNDTLKLHIYNAKKKVELEIDLVPVFEFQRSCRWPKHFKDDTSTATRNCNWLIMPDMTETTHNILLDENLRSRYWRISFQDFEAQKMKGCYHLKPTIRLLIKLRDRLQIKISSYCIITLFLWKISDEKQKEYWQKGLGLLFRIMVEIFYNAMVVKIIPYFWQETCNLIAHLQQKDLELYSGNLKKVLDGIERNDVNRVVSYLLNTKEIDEYKIVLSKKQPSNVQEPVTSTSAHAPPSQKTKKFNKGSDGFNDNSEGSVCNLLQSLKYKIKENTNNDVPVHAVFEDNSDRTETVPNGKDALEECLMYIFKSLQKNITVLTNKRNNGDEIKKLINKIDKLADKTEEQIQILKKLETSDIGYKQILSDVGNTVTELLDENKELAMDVHTDIEAEETTDQGRRSNKAMRIAESVVRENILVPSDTWDEHLKEVHQKYIASKYDNFRKTQKIVKGVFEQLKIKMKEQCPNFEFRVKSGLVPIKDSKIKRIDPENVERYIVPVEGDGNCLYRAIAHQINLLFHTTLDHGEVRKSLARVVQDNQKDPLMRECIVTNLQQPYNAKEESLIQNYLLNQYNDKEWGGTDVLTAAAWHYRVNVTVHQNQSQTPPMTISPKNPGEAEGNIHLLLTNNHYDSFPEKDISYDRVAFENIKTFKLDVIIRLPNTYLHDIKIENDQTGFVMLKTGQTFDLLESKQSSDEEKKGTYDWRDNDKYLNHNKFRTWMHGIVEEAVTRLKFLALVKGVNYVLLYKKSDLDYTLNIDNAEGDEAFKVEVDLVPVIKFQYPRWPDGYRKVEGSLAKDWLVKPEPGKSNRCWRPSFQDFEDDLMKDCDLLKPINRLIKKLRDARGLHEITNHQVRTLFLWKIEEMKDTNYWKKGHRVLFHTMVQEFYNAMRDGSIRYFWKKENNLIHLKPEKLKIYADKLKQVLDGIARNDIYRVLSYLLNTEELNEHISVFYKKQYSTPLNSLPLNKPIANTSLTSQENHDQTVRSLKNLVNDEINGGMNIEHIVSDDRVTTLLQTLKDKIDGKLDTFTVNVCIQNSLYEDSNLPGGFETGSNEKTDVLDDIVIEILTSLQGSIDKLASSEAHPDEVEKSVGKIDKLLDITDEQYAILKTLDTNDVQYKQKLCDLCNAVGEVMDEIQTLVPDAQTEHQGNEDEEASSAAGRGRRSGFRYKVLGLMEFVAKEAYDIAYPYIIANGVMRILESI